MSTTNPTNIDQHGFVRVAAACPKVSLGEPLTNANRILQLAGEAYEKGADVVLFGELGLTGYTCGDLFLQSGLQKAALKGLDEVVNGSVNWPTMAMVVGLPISIGDKLFNVGAVVIGGQVLGFVPKSYLPNYSEFYEQRHFSPGLGFKGEVIASGPFQGTPFGTDLLFQFGSHADQSVNWGMGVEICEDLWVPQPPSGYLATQGAHLILNLSASNAVIGKAPFRRNLAISQSARCLAAYAYASVGPGESTTDLVFDGDLMIFENGTLLAQGERFHLGGQLILADVDVARLQAERLRVKTFGNGPSSKDPVRICMLDSTGPNGGATLDGPSVNQTKKGFFRKVDAHPFVPADAPTLAERCHEIFQTQVAGLASRVEKLGLSRVSIGVSGGLDSTLALLVCAKVADRLGLPRSWIDGVTMPGFGTTDRTLKNALSLLNLLGATSSRLDIRQACLDQIKLLNCKPFGIDPQNYDLQEFINALKAQHGKGDLTFENVQARTRTMLLMNRGFVVGTGDMSELALGWCTFNADHMSMYNPNSSIPKTLVKFLVGYAARNEFDGATKEILLDIVDTPISPELLPLGHDGNQIQETEKAVGPYELHDFFLYHFLRYGASAQKIVFLAERAKFDNPWSVEEIRHWLSIFLKRFASQQYKRSTLPDGPKVGTISLSPRGDWRMPSDISFLSWF